MKRPEFLFLALIAATPARADVFEYGPAGAVTVHGPPRHSAPPPGAKVPSPPRIALRRLTEATALAHAGAPGVRATGLDALGFVRLFTALIDRESRFDPAAHSPKCAMGLGQLMPATAAALGVLRDPAFAIRFTYRPGALVIFDNRRLLHARDAFEGSTGHRWLQGCYMERDEVRSRYRMIQRTRRQRRLTANA
jgi:hypothetical protein